MYHSAQSSCCDNGRSMAMKDKLGLQPLEDARTAMSMVSSSGVRCLHEDTSYKDILGSLRSRSSLQQHVRRTVVRLEQVSSVFYGLYVALFGGSVYVLLTRRPNTYHLAASTAMFLLTTAFMGILLAQTLGTPIVTSSSAIIDSTTLVPCGAGTPERVHEALVADLLSVFNCRRNTDISLRGTVAPTARTLGRNGARNAPAGGNWYAYTRTIESNERESIGHAASRIWFMVRQLERTLGRATGVRYRAAMSMIIESGFIITASQLAEACTTLVSTIEMYGSLISDIAEMLTVIAPTLIIVRVGMGQGFDSVVETAHEYQASHGVRETQVRSIRFASHPTTTAEGSHLASVAANIRSIASESDTDSRSACRGHEHSDIRKEAEDVDGEKAEVALDTV
ncbi:hypothetical protein EVG20_g10502 [Dentipellis fragilis]|uniref:Uncharacterized protein n=1 Tax=Dentipellis fragilis TaxID=205917 RepID=A0A4Y9XR13_9AGAM|nr:hypothetical protein EVG20_g10502 [Dentipellis fragilis]